MEIHQSQSGMVNPMVGPGGKGGNMQRGDGGGVEEEEEGTTFFFTP